MPSDSRFDNAVFRYRSRDALLGEREELERQTVYFASPEDLNDPMEGLRQVYWRGDRITWRNLLRHYVICLYNRCIEALLTDDSQRLSPDTISVFQSLDNFPTAQARALCEACIAKIEAGQIHAALLDLLVTVERDVRFSELQQLIRMVHIDWLDTIVDVFAARNLVSPTQERTINPEGLVHVLRMLQSTLSQVQEKHPDGVLATLFDVQQNVVDQITLLSVKQHSDVLKIKRESVFFEFTSEYLKSLVKLVYPPWYVACFSAKHDNAAMWSYYAGNHEGCCLVFRITQTESGAKLRLNGPNGSRTDGAFRGNQDFALDPVQYAPHDHHLEFFTNIGRLPLDPLMRQWFQDDDGNTSARAEHLNKDRNEEWRNAYWENFTPPLLRKLPDWQHEQEFRTIISDSLGIHGSHEDRTFMYDYDTLDGIIFGINTSLSDKVRIMRILDQKLSERTVSEPFKIYQARYNARTGRIEAHHFGLIARSDKSDESQSSE